MSAARKRTLRARREVRVRDWAGEGEERVEGRRRAVIVGRVEGGKVEVARWEREWRVGRPSSPAPRTRMEVWVAAAMAGFVLCRYDDGV